jgi:hypothetical protein
VTDDKRVYDVPELKAMTAMGEKSFCGNGH